MKAAITWILVADGARARVLEHRGPGSGFTQVEGLVFTQEPLRASDMGTERPGRSYASQGSGRSAIEPKTDPVDKREADFAALVATALDERLKASAFTRLVIVAAPQTLGAIRKSFTAGLAEAVTAEIAKNLTQIPNQDIAQHLEDVLLV